MKNSAFFSIIRDLRDSWLDGGAVIRKNKAAVRPGAPARIAIAECAHPTRTAAEERADPGAPKGSDHSPARIATA